MSEQNISDILQDAPSNWGQWEDDDELGAGNFLDESQVLRGVKAVKHGKVFTLGLPINRAEGDPVAPGRKDADHFMELDKGHYEAGKADAPGLAGAQYADDVLYMFLHGTTHFDALGHFWYDDLLYNEFPAETTKGGLEKCDIKPIADHGVVGHAVVLDIANHREVDHLPAGSQITLRELQACAESQGVDLEQRDILLLRTGWLERFYDEGKKEFYSTGFDEPGLTCSDELLEWFHEMEIPMLGTDTIGNEQTVSSETGTGHPLHSALLRDQGVLFNELLKLDELAAACQSAGTFSFMYIGSPLKIVGATGSPVNPIAIV